LHTTLFRNFFLKNRFYAIREGCLYLQMKVFPMAQNIICFVLCALLNSQIIPGWPIAYAEPMRSLALMVSTVCILVCLGAWKLFNINFYAHVDSWHVHGHVKDKEGSKRFQVWWRLWNNIVTFCNCVYDFQLFQIDYRNVVKLYATNILLVKELEYWFRFFRSCITILLVINNLWYQLKSCHSHNTS
jgi:hypothetical protein